MRSRPAIIGPRSQPQAPRRRRWTAYDRAVNIGVPNEAEPIFRLCAARAIRVAFVVPAEIPAGLLDDLFAANYSAWAGRPIIPALDGEIDGMYRRLLVGADPDVVCLYCDLTPQP